MRPSWRVPGGRDGLASALAIGIVGAAFLAFLSPSVPEDSVDAIPWWRFEAASSALLIGIGVALRRRPGLAYSILALASLSIAGSVEGAWYASGSFVQFSDVPTPGNPAFGLLALAALARTTIPAAILALYATAPGRRLGPWVAPVAWAITIATAIGAFLHLGRELDQAWGQSTWSWGNEFSYQLDEPVPVLLIAGLGLLGSLRAAARTYIPRRPAVPTGDTQTATGPSRLILGAVAAAALLWSPATLAFLNRPVSLDDGDGTTRLIFVPILAALVGIVAERWSRLVAWCAVAVAFESVAFIVLYRGAADYIAYARTLPVDGDIPLPSGFVILLAAATMIVLFAFAAVSLALRQAWLGTATADPGSEGANDPTAELAADRRWAVRGSLVGLGLCAWFFGGAFLGSGVSVILGAGMLPIYAIAVALGLGVWRRFVPAVAEAESVALRPFRPLRYLETVVSEAVTARAEHKRRAANAERERLSTELHAGVLSNLERLASTTAAGASRAEVADRLRELQDAVGRLLTDPRHVVLDLAFPGGGSRPLPGGTQSTLRRPSRRELEVMGLVAAGASNEQVARELFLSLKTVESHLRRLFDRYGVTNRTELAVLAVREGWVDAP